MPYHHGNLRRALLDAALDTIATDGVAALNLRDLARRCGVSHAAPTHHFGDRTGLLTAIATEGFDGLAEATAEAWTATSSFLEVGVAYVRYAVSHPGHFAVMFRPDLLDPQDPELVRARGVSLDALRPGRVGRRGRRGRWRRRRQTDRRNRGLGAGARHRDPLAAG